MPYTDVGFFLIHQPIYRSLVFVACVHRKVHTSREDTHPHADIPIWDLYTWVAGCLSMKNLFIGNGYL